MRRGTISREDSGGHNYNMGVAARRNQAASTVEIPSAVEPQKTEKVGLLSRARNKFGGAVGGIGRALNVGTDVQVGVTQKAMEEAGFLEKTDVGAFQEVGQLSSNIDLIRRIGREKTKTDSLAGLFTANYTASTSVFSNFIREVPATTIGLLGDLFLDPLVVASKIGAVAKGTKAIGTGIKTAFGTLANRIPAVQKTGNALGSLFLTRHGQREAFKELDRTRLVSEALTKGQVNKLVSPIIEKPKAIQDRLSAVIEGADLGTEELRALALPIRQELDRVGEVISSINPKLLDEKVFASNKGSYFPRLYKDIELDKDGMAELIAKSFPGGIRPTAGRFKKRTLTPEQAEAKGLLGASGRAAKGLTQLKVSEARVKFLDEVSKTASDVPIEGWLQVGKSKSLGNLSGKFLPKSEYAAVQTLFEPVSPAQKTWLRALALWKTSKTAYNPATIARNDMTNFFVLNPLGGVGPHRLDLYAKTMNEMMTDGKLYKLAQNEGLEISSQASAELIQRATSQYATDPKLFKQFFPTAKHYHNRVVDFYGNQDKFFKLSNFIKGVTEDGLSPAQAMKRANFYLIDYSEVPKAIDWLRKSPIGVPFISFTYGVSKPLAKTLLERPDKLAAYFKVFNAIQSLNPQNIPTQSLVNEQEVLPKWIAEGTFLRLPFRDQFKRGQFVNLEYILPFNILEKRSIVPSSPVVTVGAGLITNRDPFTGRDLVEKTDSQKERIQKRAMYIYRQIVPSLAPGGFSMNKLTAAIKGRSDFQGRARSLSLTLLDILGGIKVTSIDQSVEAQRRVSEKNREIRDIQTEISFILRDKTLFPDEKKKEVKVLREKLEKTFKE